MDHTKSFRYKAVYASGAVKEEEVTPFTMRRRGCMFYPLGKVFSPENKRQRPISLFLPESLIGDEYLDYKFFLYSLNPRYQELGGEGVVYR
jgi:hypothetical protein